MDDTTEKDVECSRPFDRLLTSTRISTREVVRDLKFIFDFQVKEMVEILPQITYREWAQDEIQQWNFSKKDKMLISNIFSHLMLQQLLNIQIELSISR